MEELTTSKMSLPLMLLGVSIIAVGVNSIELVCSMGIPLAFTSLLSSLNLTSSSYYFYLVVYIIFYMLDDFLIFLLAVWTLRITSVSKKYLQIIKLVSGILLLILGLIILFNPSILAL